MATLLCILDHIMEYIEPVNDKKLSPRDIIHVLDFNNQCHGIAPRLIETAIDSKRDLTNTCFIINCPENIKTFEKLK